MTQSGVGRGCGVGTAGVLLGIIGGSDVGEGVGIGVEDGVGGDGTVGANVGAIMAEGLRAGISGLGSGVGGATCPVHEAANIRIMTRIAPLVEAFPIDAFFIFPSFTELPSCPVVGAQYGQVLEVYHPVSI